MNRFLQELAVYLNGSEHVSMKVGEVGRSQKGVPIVMVTITKTGRSPQAGGVMVVARQHGNEPAGTRATLELIRSFALDGEGAAKAIGHLTLRIIPVANPDAMDLFQRHAANGKDMNRDWNAKRLPETKAVAQAIGAAEPEVLMDLHELTPGDRDKPHILGIPASRAGELLSAARGLFADRGLPVSTRASERYHTTGLLHRHFAQTKGGVAFLVESKYTGNPVDDLDARSNYHLQAITAVVAGMSRIPNQ